MYIVASISNPQQFTADCPGLWNYVTSPEELERHLLCLEKPKAIFFPHWRWKVPPEIVNNYECIAFHATPLPEGRGGSPIQNMIMRGKTETKVTAFRMTEELDAGPVYMQQELSLHGPLHDILDRCYSVVADMITQMVKIRPEPTPQIGKPSTFKRRNPEQSNITSASSTQELYDLIRMVDADGYPRAFANIGGFRIEFRNASLEDNKVTAIVTVEER